MQKIYGFYLFEDLRLEFESTIIFEIDNKCAEQKNSCTLLKFNGLEISW